MPGSGGVNNVATQYMVMPNTVMPNNTSNCSAVPPGLEQLPILQLTKAASNTADVVFSKAPDMALNIRAIVHETINKNIPQDLVNLSLSGDGKDIKNLISIIYPCVKDSGNAQDFALLKNICRQLQAEPNNMDGLTKSLLPLVSEYGPSAITTLGNNVIKQSHDAWLQHHNSRSVGIDGKQAFSPLLAACNNMVSQMATIDVKGMTITELAQMTRNTLATCETIPLTLVPYDNTSVNHANNNPQMMNEPQQVEEQSWRGPMPSISQTTGPVSVHISNPGSSTTAQPDNLSAALKAIFDSSLDSIAQERLATQVINSFHAPGAHFMGKFDRVEANRPDQLTARASAALLSERSAAGSLESSAALLTESMEQTHSIPGDTASSTQPKVVESVTGQAGAAYQNKNTLEDDIVDSSSTGQNKLAVEITPENIFERKQSSADGRLPAVVQNTPIENNDVDKTHGIETVTEQESSLSAEPPRLAGNQANTHNTTLSESLSFNSKVYPFKAFDGKLNSTERTLGLGNKPNQKRDSQFDMFATHKESNDRNNYQSILESIRDARKRNSPNLAGVQKE